MSRKRITKYNALFTKLVLNCNEDDFALRLSKLSREENLFALDDSRFRTFWNQYKDKFNLTIEIKLKDDKDKDDLENEYLKYAIEENEKLGDFFKRIRLKRKYT